MMRRRLVATLAWLILALVPVACACAPSAASEDEIDAMCRHLYELTDAEEGMPTFERVAYDLEKCKEDPLLAAASEQTVRCRLAAEDVYSFWSCYR